MHCTSIILVLVSTIINIYGLTRWAGSAATAQTVGNTKTPISLVVQPHLNEESGGSKGTFSGNASWYGPQFQGKKTASGEIFDMYKSSAAHRHLPLITKVLVENPRNGKSAVVRVNDRGPYNLSRIMDLSRAAAIRTGIFEHGVGYIECTVINSK